MNAVTHMNMKSIMDRLLEKKAVDPESKGILLDRDCILIESDTGRSRTYYAYNFNTSMRHYLGHRRADLDEKAIRIYREKIRSLEIYDSSIPSTGEGLIEFIFGTVFTTYGFMIRIEQVELAKQMYRAMMDRAIALSDIPVGLGKTHAYLVASIVYNLTNPRNIHERRFYHQSAILGGKDTMPIIITTSSIALQKEIEKVYIPSISKMLLENGIIHAPITGVQRKGKENYICDLQLKNYVNTLDQRKKPISEYETLVKLQYGSNIDLSDVKSITYYDKRKIKVNAERCYNCGMTKQCRYQNFMNDARSDRYTFQICNHNYYLADALRRKKGLKPLLPNYKAVIIDEAHKFEAAAEDMYGISIDKSEVMDMINRIRHKHIRVSQDQSIQVITKEAVRLLESVFSELKGQLTEELVDELNEQYPIKLTSSMKSELNRLRLNLLHLSEMQPTYENLLITYLNRVAGDIELLISDQGICWIERPEDDQYIKLFSVTKRLATHIGHDIFGKDLPFIMTSGTIAIREDFSYFKKGLGIEQLYLHRIREVTKQSPYDYFNNTLLYQAEHLPFPNAKDEKYIVAIGIEIEQLLRASHGHALVLFTSYSVMQKVYNHLKDKDFGFPIFQMLRGRNQALSDYRNSVNGVLLACGSAWEGIDFAGDLLSHLIIVKLPFLVPDPKTEDQRSQFETFEEFKEKILIPRMLIRLKQGYGRAIRSEKDTAVISILDPRAKDSFRKYVYDALPKSRITHAVEDIAEFLRSKKQPDYFDDNNDNL